MFKARTSRTLLTILGMGVGISAILFLVSFGYGLQYVMLEKITTSDSLLSLDAVATDSEKLIIDKKTIEEIEAIPGVTETSPALQASSQVRYNNLISDVSTQVIKPSFLKLDGVEITKGSTLSDDSPEKIVISSAFAKIFNKEPSELFGEKINLILLIPTKETDSSTKINQEVSFEQPFEVGGIIEKDEPLIFLNIINVTATVSDLQYSQIKVKCEKQSYLQPAKDALIAMGFTVSSLSDTVDQANKFFKIIQIILAFFGIIALIVSAIGMFNTMTVTLLERTEEIGIMKSIGVSEKDILLMFVFESSIMGFFGGLTGIIIGIITGKTFNYALNFLAQRLGGEAISIFRSPLWFIGLILVIATVVGFTTGLFPARKASRLDPLDALRYK